MSANGIKALFFDVFGTLVDWRSGVAREAQSVLKPLGFALDWLALADAWREQYQPAMEEVRSGRLAYTKLDVLHRQTLKRILPRFGIDELADADLNPLILAWHRLDAWPDVQPGLSRLRQRFLIAPCPTETRRSCATWRGETIFVGMRYSAPILRETSNPRPQFIWRQQKHSA
jgi:2-haloacid dehalogenase